VALCAVAIALGVVGGLTYVDRKNAAEHPQASSMPAAVPLQPPVARPAAPPPPTAARPTRGLEVRTAAAAPVQGQGYLSVKCDPWCEIHIDGRASGHRSPALRIPIAAGRHNLVLINPTVNLSRRATVEIRPNEELSRYFNLVLNR
jgi:hypothetical protein